MPSLRQPVGPLPASIYWRRRVVVLAAIAAVIALIAWLMSGQGGGDNGPQSKTAQAAPPQSQTPAQAITPGASPSGPAAPPGGGSTGGSGGATGGAANGGPVAGSGGGEVSLSTGGSNGGAPNPAPATGGAAAGGAAGGGTGGTGGSGGSGGTGGGAPAVNTPEVMALPVCASSQVALELASAQNSYQPKDKPRLALTVRNSGANCRVDLGRAASAITVNASNGDRVWSSGDCPADRGSSWLQIPASGSQIETFTWDRSRSKPQCATADPASPANGTYVVLAELTGLSGDKVSARTSIRLDN
ncbi:hypothetical protein KV557_08315 [Kitasatospora aureofaciens]|uniref:hypothetical protein n=1 Tax=Kitasatospora aureofaciens TaxID=1894 RepID=UPI001C442CE7|nr:hypothetical protein [Kitasatospora aureofaciens]MBV6697122.1 hypothetical protein [Kitasatospora aureofaciens]